MQTWREEQARPPRPATASHHRRTLPPTRLKFTTRSPSSSLRPGDCARDAGGCAGCTLSWGVDDDCFACCRCCFRAWNNASRLSAAALSRAATSASMDARRACRRLANTSSRLARTSSSCFFTNSSCSLRLAPSPTAPVLLGAEGGWLRSASRAAFAACSLRRRRARVSWNCWSRAAARARSLRTISLMRFCVATRPHKHAQTHDDHRHHGHNVGGKGSIASVPGDGASSVSETPCHVPRGALVRVLATL